MPHLFDVHAHVNLAAFADDWRTVCDDALRAGVWFANVGTQLDTSRRAVEIADAYAEGVYAVVGLHPVHTAKSYHDPQELGEEAKGFTSRGEQFSLEAYRALAAHPKVVAIGECGLDYYRSDAESFAKQRDAFVAQIALANELQKPLMLHIRSGEGGNAYRDAAELLRAHARVGGNVHFFAGSIEDARPFLELGYTLSFTGVVTFARSYDEVVRYVPEDHILAETDAPYVTPVPHRGTRNDPRRVGLVVEALAAIRGADLDSFREHVVKNTLRLLGLPEAPAIAER